MAIMKKRTLIILITFIFALYAEDFRFYTDHASFYDNETPFVELYYMLPREALKWESYGDDLLQGKFLLAANIYRDDERVYSKTIVIEDQCSVGDTIYSNEYIPDQLSLHLEPGSYRLHTMVRDFHSGSVSENRREIKVKEYSGSDLEISDIVIASHASKATGKNKFTKPGMYDVIPMANPEFDQDNGMFYTYFEIYRLEPGGMYSTKSYIRDLNGRILMENEAVDTRAPAMFDIVIDYLDVRDLKNGIYEYCVKVQDKSTGQTAHASKRIYKIGEADMDELLYDDHYSFSAGELDSLFRILRPLMTSEEIRNYRRGNIKAKQRLFVDFWKKRDTDMTTAVNEYYLTIKERIRYADENFTYMNKGAASDRGRVLLKYGYPTEVERSGFSGGDKDHEIWQYEGMRGKIIFVFCDLRGRGYYELIHSNMEGEVYNANWKAVIQGGAKNY